MLLSPRIFKQYFRLGGGGSDCVIVICLALDDQDM